jgi:hypothetical protein
MGLLSSPSLFKISPISKSIEKAQYGKVWTISKCQWYPTHESILVNIKPIQLRKTTKLWKDWTWKVVPKCKKLLYQKEVVDFLGKWTHKPIARDVKCA